MNQSKPENIGKPKEPSSGRRALLEELKQHMLSADTKIWGLVLTGESGSGKSAVFSMIQAIMEKEDCHILAHSTGLSPRAKHVYDLLKTWNNLLRVELGMEQVIEETFPEESQPIPDFEYGIEMAPETPIEQLQLQFAELLGMVAKNKRVVLLIDALDRFEHTGRAQTMSWLPAVMPHNVRLLCTAITSTEEMALKYHRGMQSKNIDLFTTTEAKEMLWALSRRYHKTLPRGIVKMILGKKTDSGLHAASSPLWLSLAVNILMAVEQNDFDEMSKPEGSGKKQTEAYLTDLAKTFAPLPGKLFIDLVGRACQMFGKDFTRAVFEYIAISRNGLREKDLEALLSAEGIAWDSQRFAILQRWFRENLVMQGGESQWALAHCILENTLLENLLENERKAKHRALGCYLITLPDQDALKISETMYHLMQADAKEIAARYYGSYWWDTYQTNESSKAMTEAVFKDELQEKSTWINWLICMFHYADKEHINHSIVSSNLIFSLFDKHLQDDTTIQTRIMLLQAIEVRMKKRHRAASESADYAVNLSLLYIKLGDLHVQLGDLRQALDNYQASLNIAEDLRRCDPNSTQYNNNLLLLYLRLRDIYRKKLYVIKYIKTHILTFKLIDHMRKNKINISFSQTNKIVRWFNETNNPVS